VLFEIPANVLMKKFTPHAWLAGNMVLFGFTTVMQGLVKNYSGLLATRFFLGVFGKSFSCHRVNILFFWLRMLPGRYFNKFMY
jgi:nitrate/nitrite transporter NarK